MTSTYVSENAAAAPWEAAMFADLKTVDELVAKAGRPNPTPEELHAALDTVEVIRDKWLTDPDPDAREAWNYHERAIAAWRKRPADVLSVLTFIQVKQLDILTRSQHRLLIHAGQVTGHGGELHTAHISIGA